MSPSVLRPTLLKIKAFALPQFSVLLRSCYTFLQHLRRFYESREGLHKTLQSNQTKKLLLQVNENNGNCNVSLLFFIFNLEFSCRECFSNPFFSFSPRSYLKCFKLSLYSLKTLKGFDMLFNKLSLLTCFFLLFDIDIQLNSLLLQVSSMYQFLS